MPRRTKVNYFPSRGGYYCQLNRKQYLLAQGPDDAPRGPTYLAALDAYKSLLEQSWADQKGDSNTVRTILELYLQQGEGKCSPKTQQSRLYLLRPLRDALGETAVRELTASKVDQFLAQMRTPRKTWHTLRGRKVSRIVSWDDSTVTTFLLHASAAFNWAVRAKLISENPLRGYGRPGIRSRSRDCLVSPEKHQTIIRLCRYEGMRQLVIALEDTGARPGELLSAEARYWDKEKRALFYPANQRRKKGEFQHKAARYKDRTIYFTGEAAEMMEKLLKKHPTGGPFRNPQGRPHTVASVVRFFERIRKHPEVGIPELTAYSYRHTLATRWLSEGRSIEILAELLGNTPQTIRHHYSHLCGDWQGIRRQMEAFKGNTSTSGQEAASTSQPAEAKVYPRLAE